MSEAREPEATSKPVLLADREPWLVMLGLIAAIVVPAYFALDSVVEPLAIPNHRPDISPRGYTWSLLLWVVPIFFVLISFRRKIFARTKIQLWGALITTGLLMVLSITLEVLLGLRFYTFGNPEATLGWNIPVLGGRIPFEEFAFYILGYIAILLFYIWCDEIWLAKYNPIDYEQHIRRMLRGQRDEDLTTIQKYIRSINHRLMIVSIAVALTLAGVLSSTSHWPQYLVFLFAASTFPVIAFIQVAHPFINWRAFSLVFFASLLVSLLWESTLGIPYRWWGYNDAYMLSTLKARPWSNLPAEAYLVWILAPFTIVAVYETAKVWRAARVVLESLLIGDAAAAPIPKEIPGLGEPVQPESNP